MASSAVSASPMGGGKPSDRPGDHFYVLSLGVRVAFAARCFQDEWCLFASATQSHVAREALARRYFASKSLFRGPILGYARPEIPTARGRREKFRDFFLSGA